MKRTEDSARDRVRPPGQGRAAGGPLSRFEIWPNRSLDGRQTRRLLAFTSVTGAFIVARSAAIHHLPMLIGPVLAIAALAFALWWNSRAAARIGETIEIGADVVEVIPRRDRRPIAFKTGWVRVEVSQDRKVANRITLSESGRSCSVGECLSPEERLSLARALKAALAAARRPPPNAA
jgi:uncharacterized membrane protein